MFLQNLPIRRKLIAAILLTSTSVLLLTCASFVAYDIYTFRHSTVNQLTTLGEIIAGNSTASLAFNRPDDAAEILAALKAESHIVAGGLYDGKNRLFSQYITTMAFDSLPVHPEQDGHYFSGGYILIFQPVTLGTKRLGSLYLVSDMGAMRERFQRYLIIAGLVVLVSLMLALALSRRFERTVSRPILALALAAHNISKEKDYSVRAVKMSEDELGDLTESFNGMLAQIEEQDHFLREHRQRLENIVESMGDAYVSLNKDWEYTFVNSKALKLMGKEKADIMGKTLWGVFPDTKGSKFETEYRHVMLARKPTSFEIHYSSYEMWLEVRAYPHEDGIAVFYTDISKYRKAEEEIKSFNQKLEEKVRERTEALKKANEDLESFSYSVSHDLRAPLRSIHGYMKIFLEDYGERVDDEGRRISNIILKNAKKMGQLIDDLLEFSRLGRKPLSKATIAMKDLVAAVWEEQNALEDGRQINWRLNDLPLAFADAATIRHVWGNLISNARKYSRRKEGASIEVGGEVRGNEVIYFVQDNGAGFDMQYYDKLFGVFQRLHSSTEFDGTGVGLAIVHRIIVRHGGRVWANAKPNAGATFYFTLPRPQTPDNSELP
jgi:PAS domain S-box-containing protein